MCGFNILFSRDLAGICCIGNIGAWFGFTGPRKGAKWGLTIIFSRDLAVICDIEILEHGLALPALEKALSAASISFAHEIWQGYMTLEILEPGLALPALEKALSAASISFSHEIWQ